MRYERPAESKPLLADVNPYSWIELPRRRGLSGTPCLYWYSPVRMLHSHGKQCAHFVYGVGSNLLRRSLLHLPIHQSDPLLGL